MRTTKLFLGLILATSLVFQSCTENDESIDSIVIEGDTINNNGGDTGGGDTPPPANEIIELQGNITSDLTLESANTYELIGGVTVVDGVTLTIQAGTRIIAGNQGGVFSFLLIAQGAKIIAEGTSSQPIVFTSNKTTPNAGDWGGLIVAGKAPINRGATATAEVASAIYGGTDPADNSGILRFIRLEFTGGKINADSEFNGLSLYGVGNQTIVENIQVFQGLDDGFEFFGGTVNARFLVSVGAQDDSFDWTDGWVGKGQFWVALQSSLEGDRGIEADNLSANRLAEPFSNPLLSNITIVGVEDGDGGNQGILLREGTKAQIYNGIVKGFASRGLRIQNTETVDNFNNGDIVIVSNIIDNVNPFVLESADATATFVTPELKNTTGPITLSQSVIGVSTENFTDPTTLDDWFQAAPYIGAVRAENNWMAGWVRF
ncbi:MAG: multidrug transporter [Bacteroidetes bacterium]|nr:multidrug transporter [Bacteroidota bacterium]